MFELIFLFVLLCMLAIIVYQTLMIGISPMPSSLMAVKNISKRVRNHKNKTLVDLGSGFGSLAIYLAFKNRDKKVIGYEISYFPWLISSFFQKILMLKNLTFYRKD
ncbi:MAG: hypothetical protein HRT43_12020, partial [Campylobacteraceae bacterium]|nr:hypothetical protein [Campylobacteraceae bacterium]